MVNVAVLGPNFANRQNFDMGKTVGEILDAVVADPVERSTSFIVFMGKILSEDTKLCDVPKMKDSYTLHVMRKAASKVKPAVFDNAKFRECRKIMKKLNNARRFLDILYANLHNDAFRSTICEQFPALKEDRTAYRIFSDLSVCYIFLRPSNECKSFFEDHPILIEVYHHILTEVVQRANQAISSVLPPGAANPLSSSAGASGQQAPSSSRAAAGGRQLITPDMLRQAMAGALGGANAAPPASMPILPGLNLPRYAAQLAELESLGFADTEQNTNALEATNGDVGQAIELLIVMRESMQE